MKNLLKKIIQLLCVLQIFNNSFAETKTLSVNTSNPEFNDVYSIYNAVGVVKYSQRKDFMTNVSGSIDFISTKQGREVKKGEVVLIIEKTLAENTKTQAENSLQESSKLLDRNTKLYKQNFISSQDLENARLQVDMAKLNLEKANNLYENMVLIAPFDGIMGGVSYVEGEYINSSQQSAELLFSIIDPNSKQFIIFYLPEILLDKIHEGNDVKIAYQNQIQKAKVVVKSNYISQTNGGFFVKLELKDDAKLPDNSYVMAEFVIDKHQALTLPEESVMKNASGNFIYTVEGNKVKAVNVQIGTRINGLVEILPGQISPESRVVVNGLVKLSDGTSVTQVQNIKATNKVN